MKISVDSGHFSDRVESTEANARPKILREPDLIDKIFIN